ncbi:hypothetical protein HDU88_000356 [Geranomyces variabilis]|nr:hypothetical protein HDU88_000356 [Geranomyces variabilis]
MLARAAARFPPNTISRLHVRSFSQTAAARGPLFSAHVASLKKHVKEISISELNAKLTARPEGPDAAFHLLDVRETKEWNQGRLPYAVYTGRGCLERDIEGIVADPYDEIVLYCGSGMRSVLAADALQKLGYKNVTSLRGGIGAWTKEGLPLGQSSKTFSDLVDDY